MPRLLDLFCCQGGASRGYADAGFEGRSAPRRTNLPRLPSTTLGVDAHRATEQERVMVTGAHRSAEAALLRAADALYEVYYAPLKADRDDPDWELCRDNARVVLDAAESTDQSNGSIET